MYEFVISACRLEVNQCPSRKEQVKNLPVSSGVLKGSVLELIYFRIYIIDLSPKLDNIHWPYVFADDINLLFK